MQIFIYKFKRAELSHLQDLLLFCYAYRSACFYALDSDLALYIMGMISVWNLHSFYSYCFHLICIVQYGLYAHY